MLGLKGAGSAGREELSAGGGEGSAHSPVPAPSYVAAVGSVDVPVSGLLICERCSAHLTELPKSLVNGNYKCLQKTAHMSMVDSRFLEFLEPLCFGGGAPLSSPSSLQGRVLCEPEGGRAERRPQARRAPPALVPSPNTSQPPPRLLSRNYKSEVMVPVKAGGGSHCRAGQTGVCLIM